MSFSSALSRFRPYFLMGGAIFYNVVLATLIVGWQSLRTVLIDEGVYYNLCPPNTTMSSSMMIMDTPEMYSFNDHVMMTSTISLANEQEEVPTCIQQTLRLDLMFVIATSALNLSGFLVGILVDTIGPRLVCLLGVTSTIIGQLLFAFSNSVYFDAFIPAFIMIAIGGICIVSALVSMPNMFSAKVRPFLNTALMSSQDTGALTYMIFQILHHSNRKVFSLRNLFLMDLIFPLSFLLFSLFVPGRSVIPAPEATEEERTPLTGGGTTTTTTIDTIEEVVRDEDEHVYRETHTSIQQQDEKLSFGGRLMGELGQYWQQFFTLKYLALLVWGSIILSATYFYFTTQNDQWIWISGGDEKWAKRGSFIFSVLLVFVGLSSIVLTGTVMRLTGTIGGVIFVGGLNAISFVLAVIPSKNLQYVTLVTLIIGRASCFGVWLQYIFENFTAYHTTLIGFSTMTAGLVNLTNYLWTYLAKKTFHGSFLYVDIGMAVAITVATLFITLILTYQKIQLRRNKAT